MQALRADTGGVVVGYPLRHEAQHFGSPLHWPKQDAYDAQDGSAAHVVDSEQQFVLAHEVHVVVP